MNSGPANKTLFVVFFALLALLALSATSSFFTNGATGTGLALIFAAAKTSLIFTYFMRLRYQSGLVRIFAFAGFFWLGLIGVFTFADYLTRS
jgi:cytochrome c oxidase subunit 4